MAQAKTSTAATRRADRTAAAAALAAAGGATATQPAADASPARADEDPEAEPAATPAAEPAAPQSQAAENEDDDDCECPEGTDADDCDCDDEIDDGDDGMKAARARERARCAAILRHPNAVGREGVAARLAFNTNMTRSQARGVLAEMGAVEAPKVSGLAAAMSTVKPPRPNAGGPGNPENEAKSHASNWDRVLKA